MKKHGKKHEKPWKTMRNHEKTWKTMRNHEKTWKKTHWLTKLTFQKKKSTQIVEEFTETGDRSKRKMNIRSDDIFKNWWWYWYISIYLF
jgi:hypothetical protein